MAALIFGDTSESRATHLDHLVSQMQFMNPALVNTTDQYLADLANYLKIHSRHAASTMIFLNKHVQFANDRFALTNPPQLRYDPEHKELLEAARVLVSCAIPAMFILGPASSHSYINV